MVEKDVLVIIPAYNEEESIRAVLEQLRQPEIARLVDVLVINDASKDRTAQIAQAEGCAVVTHIYNLATAAACRWAINMRWSMGTGILYKWMQTVSTMGAMCFRCISRCAHRMS